MSDIDYYMDVNDNISEYLKTCYQEEIIDPDGDLFLHIGPASHREMGGRGELSESATRFQVCSATLRRASPVFKKMLYGPWSTSKPSDPCAKWIVNLPENDNHAMGANLAILNSLFEKIPLCGRSEGESRSTTASYIPRFEVDLEFRLNYYF